MDFLADENIPRPMISKLRLAGFTVHSVAEGVPGLADPGVLQIAAVRGLVLITHDHDFGELAVFEALPVRGVILIELERFSLPKQIDRLIACIKDTGINFEDAITVIEPSRIRTRLLPNVPSRTIET